MRVAIFQTKDTLWARALLHLVADGVRQIGDTVIDVPATVTSRSRFPQFDVGVQLCFANKMDNEGLGEFRLRVAKECHYKKVRLLTIDTGFIGNQMDYQNGANPSLNIIDPKTYWPALSHIYFEVGYDGLKRGADYCCPEPTPSDRWKKLGRELKPWRTEGEHILLIGQTIHGISTQDVDVYDWYAQALSEIRRQTNRVIVFRPHPRVATKVKGGDSTYRRDRRSFREHSQGIHGLFRSKGGLLTNDLQNAWAVVVLTSNAGVTAAVEGIPVFALNPLCMAWDVAHVDLSAIEQPKTPDRTEWANKIAYSQWTGAEMRDGQMWRHLRPHADRPPNPIIDTLGGYL